MEYIIGKQRRLTKFWLRCRPLPEIKDGNSMYQGISEFYVPWWAWPLEIFYNLVFGKVKLND